MNAMKAYLRELQEQNESLVKRIIALESGRAVPEVELYFSTPNGSSGPEGPKEAVRPPKEAVRPPEKAVRPPEKAAKLLEEATEGPRPFPQTSSTDFAEKSMEFMVLMVGNMKELQRKFQEDKDEGGMVRGVEVVRPGVHELPQLPVWSSTQAPLQLSDWLLHHLAAYCLHHLQPRMVKEGVKFCQGFKLSSTP